MTKPIPFSKPHIGHKELGYLKKVLDLKKLSGDGPYNKLCSSFLKSYLNVNYVQLTPSCTTALEMAYLLIDLQPEDEVILPSYTFTSTATAITLFHAKPVFIDVDETLNIDVNKIEKAITNKTKAVCVVHYAGTSCDLDKLKELLNEKNIFLIEDAAQALGATYKKKALGSFGDISAFSFHETKNVVCGEGGAIVINNSKLIERAEIIKDKGTNRQRFLRGEIDKYTWQDKGSSYLLGELPAAYLFAQLEILDLITEKRRNLFEAYYNFLLPFACENKLKLPIIPNFSKHNGHIFYLILESEQSRNELKNFLKIKNISAVPHYVPLHDSVAGKKFSRSVGSFDITKGCSSRLLRLPMYYDLSMDEVEYICSVVVDFFNQK